MTTFFFSSYGDHRDLHSFPTRRSSDLLRHHAARGEQSNAGPRHCFCRDQDRKSTRLNSSHVEISYAVFCLKKKRSPPPPRYTGCAAAAPSCCWRFGTSPSRSSSPLPSW